MESNQQNTFRDRSPFGWLDTFISQQIPPALIRKQNPLFERQLRLLRWPRAGNSVDDRYVIRTKIDKIKEYTFIIGMFLPLPIAFFEACAFIGVPFLINIVPRVILVTLGFSLVCDIQYALSAVNTISSQTTTGQREQLRLTMLTDEDILLANYATIQIQVWRTAIVEMSVRT